MIFGKKKKPEMNSGQKLKEYYRLMSEGKIQPYLGRYAEYMRKNDYWGRYAKYMEKHT